MFEAKFDKKFKFTNSSNLKHKDFTGAKSINLNDLRQLRDDGGLFLRIYFINSPKQNLPVYSRLAPQSAAIAGLRKARNSYKSI